MKTGRAHSLADSMKRLMAAVWVLLGIVLLGSCSEEGIEVDEVNKQMPKPLTKDEYKQMMHGFFPMLKRWRK